MFCTYHSLSTPIALLLLWLCSVVREWTLFLSSFWNTELNCPDHTVLVCLGKCEFNGGIVHNSNRKASGCNVLHDLLLKLLGLNFFLISNGIFHFGWFGRIKFICFFLVPMAFVGWLICTLSFGLHILITA